MPRYNELPAQGSITIEEALKAGKKDITQGARWFMVSGPFVGIAMAFCGLSYWFILVCIVSGIVCSFVYTIWITPKWRIWAYSGVADIHQFQHCAEMEQLLPLQSPMLMTGIMSFEQRQTLARLQQRFEEDSPFIDDPDVAQVTMIYPSALSILSDSKPLCTISRKGIETRDYGNYDWANIWDEHVGTKQFTSRGNLFNMGLQSSSSDAYFCFTCPDLQVEVPMASLNVDSGELEQILYIHRGRFDLDHAGQAVTVPIKGGS